MLWPDDVIFTAMPKATVYVDGHLLGTKDYISPCSQYLDGSLVYAVTVTG